MEFDNIENIVAKYFQGETTLAEEKELKNYFSSPNVAQHLEQYKPLFGYFSQEKEHQSTQESPLNLKTRTIPWLAIAASAVILLGLASYFYNNQNKEVTTITKTDENPETVFLETKKALALLSRNVNTGLTKVHYLKEYEQTKNKIFKK